ncbi:MAG TPA: prefoldin subunit alpha [Thermoplasmata archaeon]|nr:prefoldin subunit alpha [Thermoplasmata archaeon]
MNEQERAQLASRLESLREDFETLAARLEAVGNQAQMLASTLAQVVGAREAMEKYASGEGEEEVLVPVGADAFFHGKLANRERAVVGVGVGVFLEMPVAKGKEIYEKRVEEIKAALSSLEQTRGKLDSQQKQMADQYNQLVEIAQSEGAEGAQPVQFFGADDKQDASRAKGQSKKGKGRRED